MLLSLVLFKMAVQLCFNRVSSVLAVVSRVSCCIQCIVVYRAFSVQVVVYRVSTVHINVLGRPPIYVHLVL